jgi:hypothetical protein
MTAWDCPGERLYEPPPLTMEKSVPEMLMLPLKTPEEVDELLIVTVLSRD